jgi:hypothetical protein
MGGITAVDCWFWDGGHGRNNVHPAMDKIGFCDARSGGSGFNNGSQGPCVLPRFSPPFEYGPYGKMKPRKPTPKPDPKSQRNGSPFSGKKKKKK